jgi:hypothetical protein
VKEIGLEPEPSILIESLRDIGYSFNSAIADIVDNSITAGASNISILAIPTDEFRIAIIDDGVGLSRDDLLQAMRLGSNDPREVRAENDLGRFGLGLKTASFSQCRRLTVVSKSGESFSAFTWDLDLVVKNNSWTVIEQSDLDSVPFVDQLSDTGTLVLWEKLDRLTGSHGSGKVNYDRLISEAQDYLSLVFHRYISGERGLKRITIRINNRTLDPIDPFNSGHHATQVSPQETLCPGVTMRAYTLPHRSRYDSQAEYEKYGLEGGYLKNQGIYLYRAKRLIVYGTWFGLAKKTALTQLTRVKIDIDVNQDEYWKIDVKKVSAQLPEVVRSRIKHLVATIGAPSRRTYKKRAARLTNTRVFPIWNVEQSGENRLYKIDRTHPVINDLRESLNEDHREQFDTVLSLIESTFPKEALYYDFANNEEAVTFNPIDESAFCSAAKTFFASLKLRGFDEEKVLNMMKGVEPFASHWNETLKALNIEES